MDYKTFDRLYKRDPLLFSLAMELFMDKGRTFILGSSKEELAASILQKLTSFFMESRMQDTIDTAVAFARLNTGDLLDYARRSGYYLGDRDESAAPNSTF